MKSIIFKIFFFSIIGGIKHRCLGATNIELTIRVNIYGPGDSDGKTLRYLNYSAEWPR